MSDEPGRAEDQAESPAVVEPEPTKQGTPEPGRLPPPNLPDPPLAASPLATPPLDELLEHSARMQAARFGAGTLVAECLDTHNPHLPRRVFVRTRDEDGKPITAWVPTLAELRPRIGQKLLLSKPDNWPEPVVIGVLAGLARDPEEALEPLAEPASGPRLELAQGETLAITGPEGQPLLELTSTPEGPRVTLLQSNVTVDMPGVLRLAADRIELSGGEGGVDIRADGDTVVRSRTIRLN